MKKETKKIVWFSAGSFFAGFAVCAICVVIIAYSFSKKQTENSKEYLTLLQSSDSYNNTIDKNAPQFIYQSSSDTNLVRVRKHFNLDSVAGNGDEISKIKKLMYFVHNSITHDGNNQATGVSRNSIDLFKYVSETGNGINCRMMAIALNEFYLSMGFYSRFVTCLPQDSTDTDCHVINSVYSKTLNKWIMIDPTFAAYITDENENLLSISEVKMRLINDMPLKLNEDANWNHKTKQTADYYLKTYMAKNLYWLSCITESCFAVEDNSSYRKYVYLCPTGFTGFKHYTNYYITNNSDYFWQNPFLY
ncbi:MAG: hypothetical protein LBH32_13430 [Dysgonamonadaceae bacterium]|jgi:hypothetical protein|nr:hypothetical protein [Dysgonamonadaceae bacterium]